MTKPALPRSKLTLWALTVLSDTAEGADHAPVPATPRLRLALAWLASATDEGPALDLFWQDAREALGYPGLDTMKAYRRGTALCSRFTGICERLGVDHYAVREYAAAHPQEWP